MAQQWAGNFDCSECGRKRLIADEFSKKMLDKRKKVNRHPPVVLEQL